MKDLQNRDSQEKTRIGWCQIKMFLKAIKVEMYIYECFLTYYGYKFVKIMALVGWIEVIIRDEIPIYSKCL
jgi:hypothetical protein